MPVREILQPMLASLSEAPLDDRQFVYEPKYDGIRAIAEVGDSVRLWSRLGNEKTRQFPEVAAALERWSRQLKAPVILDGEIVALDAAGEPTGFQQLQGRIHLSEGTDDQGFPRVAFVVFDLLKDGATDLRGRPLAERRVALERLLARTGSPVLRISEQAADGRALYSRALASGWEGLIAKQADSRYKSGKRTPEWRKLKIVQEQEFVVGGWTEPRQSREYFGALLLGVYDDAPRTSQPAPRTSHAARRTAHAPRTPHLAPRTAHAPRTPHLAPRTLIYCGHTGTGFNDKELARVMKRLRPLETGDCPFATRPKTNERAHWVKPTLVAQIKFTEWTADGKLRHPVYLGLRDDKEPEEVHREQAMRLNRVSTSRLTGGADPGVSPGARVRSNPAARPTRADTQVGATGPDTKVGPARADTQVGPDGALIDQLRAIEDSHRDGILALPGGDTLAVTNLHKVFWPTQKLTKGDLIRYYVRVAGCLLPAVASRPLVMKRLPNGITGKAFYQQRAPDDVPEGVRVQTVEGDSEVPSRLIGGALKTLLYMTQLAAISQDPWFSRVESPDAADYVALDLDPAEGVGFDRVLQVARWIHDELEWLGAAGVPKTSGADGLHIYIPLPPQTPYDAGLLFCQIVATVVAQKHPREATVERAVRARGKRVYIDYLQNIRGKTLATAYSARASDYAGVSAPLTWQEVHDGVDREAFTIATMPERIERDGDLWKALRDSKGIDLSRVSRYAERSANIHP